MDRDLRVPGPVPAAVSAGGALGALARYGVSTAWPHAAGAFAWSTWAVNVSGCFLIGVLMVVAERRLSHRQLIRPFLGTGFLGGYTTFSAFVVDVQQARPAVALLYLGATVVAALLAVAAGTALAAAVVRPR
jgi:CrcB protein